jgi:hypothetical protein
LSAIGACASGTLARRGQELGDLLAEAETSQQTRQN